MTNTTSLISKLKKYNLEEKEAIILAQLYRHKYATPNALSKASLINRTTVYRVIRTLILKNLVVEVKRGNNFTVKATDPFNLEKLLDEKIESLQETKRKTPQIINEIQQIQDDFSAVKTTPVVYYHGENGLKQFLWHTTKSKTEIVGYSYLDWNQVIGKKYAEQVRLEYVVNKLKSRELLNERPSQNFSSIKQYLKIYENRIISKKKIAITHDTYIYDDKFCMMYFKNQDYFAIEIINQELAKTQQQIFEQLWKIAK